MNRAAPTGRRVVVTGGASGIGAATVMRMHADGAVVTILDKDLGTEPFPAEVLRREADVTSAAQVGQAMDWAASEMGGVDVLVSSAGMALRGSIEETDPEQWDAVFAVNVRGIYLAARAALPYLRKGRDPAIVNVASQLGVVASERNAAYCASKGAVVQLTRAMAIDAIGSGVRVNAVCPGATRTPMTLRHYSEEDDTEGRRVEQLIARLIDPEEIADAIAFLASRAASAMVGSITVVDGGYTIH